ncbi:MAG: hypothetical protein IH840_03335 [Candidatus Heimdallarchaeota archaeon]|nr:hypothetical protein [Candidatus Heimdallarchaeota archaeon]
MKNLRSNFRNKITGFIFGKYDLQEVGQRHLIKEEEYISGIEIISYDEVIYLLSLVGVIALVAFSISFSFLFLFLIFPILYVVYLATELELVMLTSERVIIERRSIVEKLLKTSNIQSISIDQIAVISHSRPPFQIPTIVLGIVGFSFSVYNMLVLTETGIIGLLGFHITLLPFEVYLIYYGLRLNKRSIELAVIGVPDTIGIGRKKGAVLWFLDDLIQLIFERVHHIFHDIDEGSRVVQEFPLEYSGTVKRLIKEINRPVQRKILELLDQMDLPKKVVLEKIAGFSKQEIDEGMRQLRESKLLYYDRSKNMWCLNRDTIE